MWIEMFGGSIYDDHVDILKADRFHCCNYLFRGYLCISENMLLWLITRFCKFPPIKKYKKYHQIRAETESQNLRNRGNSWKTHLKNLISARWDSYQKHNMEQIAGGWWSWDVQRGLFVVFKENTFTTGCPKCWTFAILAWRFGILDPPWIPRNSQFGALFFLAEISGWQRGRKPCFVAESPSSCDMYRVRTESQLLGWSRMTDWHRLGKSGKSKAKRPSQKSEELQSWLVWEWVLNLKYLWIESYSFFWWVL